jgi:hypothetical protein
MQQLPLFKADIAAATGKSKRKGDCTKHQHAHGALSPGIMVWPLYALLWEPFLCNWMIMHELAVIPHFALRIRQLTESLQGRRTLVSATIMACSCSRFIAMFSCALVEG